MDELLIRRTVMLVVATMTTREAISVLRVLADGSPDVGRVLHEERNKALAECSYLLSGNKPTWKRGEELALALEYFVDNAWKRQQHEIGAALRPGLNGLMAKAHVFGVRGVPKSDRGLCHVFETHAEDEDEPFRSAA